MVSNKGKLDNNPICVIDTNLGSSIFYNDLELKEETQDEKMYVSQNQQTLIDSNQKNCEEGMWNLHFDGAMSKE